MNKQALVEWVHEKIGGTKVQAEEVVNGMFDAIVATLKKGGEVSIAGLGIFSVKTRAARMARNPRQENRSKYRQLVFQSFERLRPSKTQSKIKEPLCSGIYKNVLVLKQKSPLGKEAIFVLVK